MTIFKAGDRVWFEGNKYTLEDSGMTFFPLRLKEAHVIFIKENGCQLSSGLKPSIKLE